MACRFACIKYELINGTIISLKNTNIAYVKLHILKVKGIAPHAVKQYRE